MMTMKRNFLFFLLLVLVAACEQGSKVSYSTHVEYSGETALEDPFIHSVYFWFKEGTTPEQKESFMADTEAFIEIESVKALYAGTPAPSADRPVVDKSYDFSVILHFEDLAGHDAYQEDPMHLEMIEKHSDIWERVLVMDSK